MIGGYIGKPIGGVIAPEPHAIHAPGGLQHIKEGMGDTSEGVRVSQTLHTIEQGIAL